MSPVPPIPWRDATDLAQRIAAGELTAADAVETAIARIESLNPTLNAVVADVFEQARRVAAAPAPNAPFAGVPFLLKDLGAGQRGLPYYAGNRALRDAGNTTREDSALGARFRRLGLVTLGRTTTAEMGAQTTTQPLAFGPARNPWHLTASTSGSSGGSAAAVAAGLVPLAHGNDGLGSIRLPAAWCGLVGFKPSRGLVPVGVASTSRMNHEFVLSRSVRDAAAVLDGVRGASGELYTIDPRVDSFAAAARRPPAPLRVGLLCHLPDQVTVRPAIVAAVQRVGHLLEAMGHHVEVHHPAALFEDQSPSLAPDRPSDYRRRLRAIGAMLGRPVREEDVEPYLWSMAYRDHDETVDSYVARTEWQQEWAGRVLGWWAHHDLLVTPTIATGPEPLAELAAPADDPARLFARIRRHITATVPFNVTGQPALALPVVDERAPGEVPPSVQLVGAPGRDDVVLAAAAQLAAAGPALPWPPVATGH